MSVGGPHRYSTPPNMQVNMGIYMNSLSLLHQDMVRKGIDQYRFRIDVDRLSYDCIFVATREPFELGLACLEHSFTLLFQLDHKFETSGFISDTRIFNSFSRALKKANDGWPGLRMPVFLLQVDRRIPSQATLTSAPTTESFTPSESQAVNTEHKPYLCGWKLHSPSSGRNVSLENLRKTEELLGQEAGEFCRRHNVSTCWTHVKGKAKLWKVEEKSPQNAPAKV